MGLTYEQQLVIDTAKSGSNILVDACIGSGKTTTIQHLCNELSNKSILYLTYNKLLKFDAKHKITNPYVLVQNYHGYASLCLSRCGVHTSVQELISEFIERKPIAYRFDVLIIDEYQDIDEEISKLLLIVKEQNPHIQIIAVGDYCQKIYDKTTLNVRKFIIDFLGTYEQLYFTNCFRLNNDIAQKLGMAWQKKINGINESCSVEFMSFDNAVEYIASREPHDVLCLGERRGKLAKALNILESKYPYKYNKNTAYATIRDDNGFSNNKLADDVVNSAIFTTFDGSKGLERPVCVLFDYTIKYWNQRNSFHDARYEIVRNIFCVAASRGKEKIIFVETYEAPTLPLKWLSMPPFGSADKFTPEAFNMSTMFEFKFKEDVDQCFKRVKTKVIREPSSEIDVTNTDGLIDLSPCIGIFQEQSFFNKYDIDTAFDFDNDFRVKKIPINKLLSTERKILKLVALETKQNRYEKQVTVPFVSDIQTQEIHDRLRTVFDGTEEVQIRCEKVVDNITFKGIADVIKNNILYELKFTDELSHENILQCACYITTMGYEKGILWNVRNNHMIEIKVPYPKTFWQNVIKCVMKRPDPEMTDTNNYLSSNELSW